MQVRARLIASTVALVSGLTLLTLAACGGGETGATDTGATTGGDRQGGTLRVNIATDTDYTDPALAYYQISWQHEYATCAKLLNYPDKPAPEGSQLQPEVAAAMPTVSEDGRTYTFKIRKGFRFSPPSTEEVSARTFKFVIERDLDPTMSSPAVSFIRDVVGAEEYKAGKAKEVTGVVARGDTLTITLKQTAPDFLARISMPFFCALPMNTPVEPKGVDTPAAAGPYYIVSRTPNRQIVLERNPNYGGDRPANPDQIVYQVGTKAEQSVLLLRRGEADYIADALPPAVNAELARDFGPESRAAKEGKQQYFINPALVISYLGLNTSRELFKDVNLRKAVNYAVNRPALIRQSGAFGGTPTDQYLPPAVLGFKDQKVYPLEGPDLEKARQLAGDKQRKAVLYTCNTGSCPGRAQVIQANLKEIGIDVEIRQWDRAIQFAKEGTRGEPFDIADEGWIADYPDPYDFINILLDGRNIQPKNNVNFSYFNDPAYNRKMDAAAQLSGDARAKTYEELDLDIAKNAAPLALYMNDNVRDFFSARVGCQVYQPIYQMDLAALCIRG